MACVPRDAYAGFGTVSSATAAPDNDASSIGTRSSTGSASSTTLAATPASAPGATPASASTAASTSTAITAFSALRRDDQLEEFFRATEQGILLFGVHADGACGQLRCDCGFRNGRIRGYEADFIDLNVGIALQRCFQLICQLCGLACCVGGESLYQTRQAGLRHFWGEMDAGDAR
jgi:hypothetical protein